MENSISFLEKKNVFVLAMCQVLFNTGQGLIFASAPLVGLAIAPDQSLATLPISVLLVGTVIATLPAPLLMRRIGRKAGFIVGSLIGTTGGGLSILGVANSHFGLFCLGLFGMGLFAGFAHNYRYAAADTASPSFRSRAISLVLAGGVLAAFFGPNLARFGRLLIEETQFLGTYSFLLGTTLLSALVVSFLSIPNISDNTEEQATPRSIFIIIRQPIFVTATLVASLGYAVMALLMTAAPIAMHGAHHSFSNTAFVIEWHIFAMFAPGFITGSLIKRFGVINVINAGLLLLLCAIFVALTGFGMFEFWTSLFLLGIGWNFTFTGGSTLLTEVYQPVERNITQGANNFFVFSLVALVSLSSGVMMHYFGWQIVNIGAIPLVLLTLASTIWLSRKRSRGLVEFAQ